MMTRQEKIEFYSRFEEGSELGDAVGALLDGASTLNGLGETELAVDLILLAVEKTIKDYFALGKSAEMDWYEYGEIDAELYENIMGTPKLTEVEYRFKRP